MIFYSSATGNCKYAAQCIAASTEEAIHSITECKNSSSIIFLRITALSGSSRPLTPGDCQALCGIFCMRLCWTSTHPTCGFSPHTERRRDRQDASPTRSCRKKVLSFAAYFSVKMPDTWTPIFDLSDLQKVRRINLNAEREIDFAIKKIQSRSAGDYMRTKCPQF